ncbi:MAG: hypothetical protein AAGA39_00095 [Pseudomonadota bacterium]
MFDQPVDTILHIGAGRGRELPDYLASTASKIVLVDGDPAFARMLRRLSDREPRVEVIEAVAAADSRDATYYRYNLERLNGLVEKDKYTEQYAGLRLIVETAVETTAVGDLVAGLGLAETTVAVLVLETPGEEAAMIRALSAADRLACFSSVVIRTPFSDEEVDASLRESGFTVDVQDKALLRTISARRLRCSQDVAELSALRADIKSFRADVESLRERNKALEEQLEASNADGRNWEKEVTRLQLENAAASSMREDVIRLEAQLEILKGLAVVGE